MGQSDSQPVINVKPVINKTLNINNTGSCVIVDKNGKLIVGKCGINASRFTFKNGEFINDSNNTCVNSKLQTGTCDLDSETWSYDPATGYVKNNNSGKCLVHNNGVLSTGKDVPCSSFNYGPLNTYTEKDRDGKCGSFNLVPQKLNYAPDDGKCNSDKVCSPLGVCVDNNYRNLDYDSKYQYLYKKGKYDGLKTFTESDRNGKCGPSYLLPLTKGYLPDSGKCDAGRYCSAYGECSNLPDQSLMNWKGAYDGVEVLTINTNTPITPPESNYNIVYPESYNYFANKGLYKKF
jgi:hypothetical protein